MKKTIFSIVALVAISTASMANNVAAEQVNSKVEVESNAVVKEKSPCDALWIGAYRVYIQNYPGSEGSPEAYAAADQVAKSMGC